MATDHHAEPFQGIADPTRRRILELLAAASRPVREIAARFPVSRPAISKHLRLLREAGLVTESRRGRERIYELVPGALEGVAGWLSGLSGLSGLSAGAPPADRVPLPLGSRPAPAPRAAGRPVPARKKPRPARSRPDGAVRARRRPATEEPSPAADWRVW